MTRTCRTRPEPARRDGLTRPPRNDRFQRQTEHILLERKSQPKLLEIFYDRIKQPVC